MAVFQISPNATKGNYYYHLRANGNHEIILRGENYESRQGCENGVLSVKANAPYDYRYERLYSADRKYYFNLKGANGQVIGTSETYETGAARDHGIELVKAQAPTATID